MTKFMKTKDRCLQCGEKLQKDMKPIKTKDGKNVCSEWCKDNWNMDVS